MNDPLDIFEAVYQEWRPPDRPEPTWRLLLWPALAGAATLVALIVSQTAPVRDDRGKPSAILVQQMSDVDSVSAKR